MSRKKLYPYWKEFCKIHDYFYKRIGILEKKMSEELKTPDLGFIHDAMCMGWAGIGHGERLMKLHQFDLE